MIGFTEISVQDNSKEAIVSDWPVLDPCTFEARSTSDKGSHY